MEKQTIKNLLIAEQSKPYAEVDTLMDGLIEISPKIFLQRKAVLGSQHFEPQVIDENEKKTYSLRKGNKLYATGWN